ncbi:peptide-methionine (S)-S-oxide reductase MsrA [Phenylobacterium sp. J367]|uniref:peptide-methionine (S)-S-oxide reductase MsrA n=1 Tax=Phenylobacterium sp. J367 TaxID=2898435 RepID=UPI002150AFB6|nr:peptide-methionine (S)-S-oxide reductase MsrA [Phenylobacterium sp. J367]MCR5877769.1 peptide-methionine (S)-S-oxide reductase MsrA [Phenylobacterium sp. J367]
MKIRLFAAIAASALALGSAAPAQSGLKTAVFAGGCFWSVEKFFEAAPGVVAAVSGYSGGALRNPTYENHQGHLEAVKVTYDPAKVSYGQLVDYFFHNIDPTDPNGQICDKGPSYRTAVFVTNAQERQAAEAVVAKVQKELPTARIATQIRPAATFWNAEAYHQDFAKKNPRRYDAYRIGCGRDRALKVIWGGR